MGASLIWLPFVLSSCNLRSAKRGIVLLLYAPTARLVKGCCFASCGGTRVAFHGEGGLPCVPDLLKQFVAERGSLLVLHPMCTRAPLLGPEQEIGQSTRQPEHRVRLKTKWAHCYFEKCGIVGFIGRCWGIRSCNAEHNASDDDVQSETNNKSAFYPFQPIGL